MAKFSGVVGYGEQVEVRPGYYDDVITERKHVGDIVSNRRRYENGDQVNTNITVNNSISIIADSYAKTHFFAMRYVKWAGALWTITEVEDQSPRLILRLGGVYNGPTAPVAS